VDTLRQVWRGEQPVTALPETVRQQLAGLYSQVSAQNPSGFAQSEFNAARANYLLGNGPNPGPNVNDFAAANHIPMSKK
jgi:hypothetical protein